MLGSKFIKFLMSNLKWQVNSSSNFCVILHSHDITPLWILSSYVCNFGLKDLIKIPILRLSSALVKICYIRHVIFNTTSQFKVMLDKSVNNDLGERMQLLDKRSPLSFNFLDIPLLVLSHRNSSYDL